MTITTHSDFIQYESRFAKLLCQTAVNMGGLPSLSTSFLDVTPLYIRPLRQKNSLVLSCGAHTIIRAYQVSSQQDDQDQMVNHAIINKVKKFVTYQLLMKDETTGIFDKEDDFHKAVRKLVPTASFS